MATIHLQGVFVKYLEAAAPRPWRSPFQRESGETTAPYTRLTSSTLTKLSKQDRNTSKVSSHLSMIQLCNNIILKL